MTSRSLRLRLTAWYAGSLFVVLLGFGLLTLWIQWAVLRDALDHHLEEDLAVAAQMLTVEDRVFRWRSADPIDPGYDDGPLRWVEVWDAAGSQVFVRGTARHLRLQAALGHEPGAERGARTVRPIGEPPLRLLVLSTLVDEVPVTVRVGRTETKIRSQIWGSVISLLVAIPVAITFICVGGYLMARRALLPLAQMTAQAKVIGADRLAERLAVGDPHDELGELATVFNQMFARLEDAFERLRRFTADASHELRTPLTAIRSVGEVGLRDDRPAEAYRDTIGSMLEETDRLTRLVDSLLTLSRWDSGRVAPHAECLDLVDLADDVVEHLGVLGEERRVRVEVASDGPAMVLADRLMLRQAVINLVDNAIKFSPVGGRVEVRVTDDGTRSLIAVADEGPGIPAEHRGRVFDRFYRVDKGRAREEGGAGLGLAIAHWAVSSNGGRIGLQPGERGGTTFTLSFPSISGSIGTGASG